MNKFVNVVLLIFFPLVAQAQNADLILENVKHIDKDDLQAISEAFDEGRLGIDGDGLQKKDAETYQLSVLGEKEEVLNELKKTYHAKIRIKNIGGLPVEGFRFLIVQSIGEVKLTSDCNNILLISARYQKAFDINTNEQSQETTECNIELQWQAGADNPAIAGRINIKGDAHSSYQLNSEGDYNINKNNNVITVVYSGKLIIPGRLEVRPSSGAITVEVKSSDLVERYEEFTRNVTTILSNTGETDLEIKLQHEEVVTSLLDSECSLADRTITIPDNTSCHLVIKPQQLVNRRESQIDGTLSLTAGSQAVQWRIKWQYLAAGIEYTTQSGVTYENEQGETQELAAIISQPQQQLATPEIAPADDDLDWYKYNNLKPITHDVFAEKKEQETDLFALSQDIDPDIKKAPLPIDQCRIINRAMPINVVLANEILTDLPGPTRFEVVDDLLSRCTRNRLVLLPSGSILFAEYEINDEGGYARLQVNITDLLTPEGQNIPLSTIALDRQGRAGITGKIDHRLAERYLFSAIVSALTVGVGVLGDSLADEDRFVQNALQRFADNLGSSAIEALEQGNQLRPRLEIAVGTRATLYVTQDYLLVPPLRIINTN